MVLSGIVSGRERSSTLGFIMCRRYLEGSLSFYSQFFYITSFIESLHKYFTKKSLSYDYHKKLSIVILFGYNKCGFSLVILMYLLSQTTDVICVTIME